MAEAPLQSGFSAQRKRKSVAGLGDIVAVVAAPLVLLGFFFIFCILCCFTSEKLYCKIVTDVPITVTNVQLLVPINRSLLVYHFIVGLSNVLS